VLREHLHAGIANGPELRRRIDFGAGLDASVV
jgi:hypothetical protein